MKNRVLLKSALLLLLIAADGLVTASEDDDLIFDPEGKQTAAQAPLIETHQDHSLFHRIKRGVWDFFTSSSTTTTTQAPPGQKEEDEDQNQDIDKSVILNVGVEGNHTLDQPETPNAKTGIGGIERLILEKNEDNDEADDEHENEISNAAESQRIPITYGNSDDEDLAGSGEIEGSAGEVDYHPNAGNQHRSTDGKARFYRITLTVGEPYRREYADRNSPEYRELSGNLTEAVENLYNRHIPGYNHFASVVKISPTADAFTSQVTLDIGSTFTDEVEVRAILEQQLQFHSLGSIQVGPEGFTFRIFQAGEKDTQPECDQTAELRCRSGECVPLEYRCDGVLQCNDGSDEDNCPTDSNRTRDDFDYTTVVPQHFPSEERTHTPEVKSEVSAFDIREKEEESTLRSSSNKCRADDTVRCHDGSRYICSVQQCDGIPDCDDAGDEVDCPHPGCSVGEFACDVNRCILESQRCNFVEDCQDGSDEHDCHYPACSSTEFICRNGQCIDSNKYCDGVQHCHDGSDEHNCPCKEDQFECAPGYCVPLSRRCDGYTDCVGGRDEQNCYNMTRCRADEFECAIGSCVSKNARCDGRNDCFDHSDEYNCNVTTCSGDQFRCLDGICLSIDKRCNGVADCRNGEDESQCGCGDGEFRCTDGRCISYVLQCNGVNECSDGSDERDCEKHPWRNFYNAGKFAIARKSSAAISYGGKLLAERRRNMNMQPVATESAYRLAIKPAVTIGNPILEAFPEEAQRRRFPNSMQRNSSAYLIKIASKSQDNDSLSLWRYIEFDRSRKPDANCSNVQVYYSTVDHVSSRSSNESQIPKPLKLSDNLLRQIFQHNNISMKNVHSQSVNNRDGTRKMIGGSNPDQPRKSNASNLNAMIINFLYDIKRDRHATEKDISKLENSNVRSTFSKKEIEYRDKIERAETKLKEDTSNRNETRVDNAKVMPHSRNVTLEAVKNARGTSETLGRKARRRHGSAYQKYYDKYLIKLMTSSTVRASTELAARTSTTLKNTFLKNIDEYEVTEAWKAEKRNMAEAVTESIRSDVLFNKTYKPWNLRDNYIERKNNSDSKENFFGYEVRKDSRVSNYFNKYLKNRYTPSKRIAPVTVNTNKIEEYPMTNIKHYRTQKAALPISKGTSATAKTNQKDYSSIKTENLLYEFNSPEVEIRRYSAIDADDVNIISNLPTLDHNLTETNRGNKKCNETRKRSNTYFEKFYGNHEEIITQDDDKIDSGLINSDETPKLINAIERAYVTSKESQESRETLEEESPKDDFDILILSSTTTRAPEIVTWDAGESREKASTERHGKRRHKSRHNGHKNNRSKKRKKNRDAKRKRKPTSTVASKVDEPTSVDYGNAYSSERARTTLSHNDSGYDKADDNWNTSTGRNDWYLSDEITTEPFKTEFSHADESASEHPVEHSIRNGLQPEETTNADLVTSSTVSHLSTTTHEKVSKKCKVLIATTTESAWFNWSADDNKKTNEESTDDECEDVTSFPIVSESVEEETSYYDTSVSDNSSTYDTLSWKFSSEKDKDISNEEITTTYSTIKDKENNKKSAISKSVVNEESDESNKGTQFWDQESITHFVIGGTTHDVNSDLGSEEEEEDVTEKSISAEDNEIDNDAVAMTEDYEIDNCKRNQHACDKYTCIEEDQVCDGIVDCLNASDETDCDYIYVKRLEEHFRAINKEIEFISSNTVGDASLDGCDRYEHPCDGTCINALNVCDGKRNCLDGTDEENCTTEECPDGQLPCDNGVCINKNFFCDHNIDCHDASDERNCPDSGETGGSGQECHPDSFTCSDGSCIPRAAVCDGRADCPHDEDEINCRRGCTRDQFQCANGDCIRADQRCNGYIECADGSDEPEECEPPEPSPSGQCTTDQYTCISDRRCVPLSSICNGIPECRDGSDEHSCDTHGTSDLRLKTYPSEQVIKESREVVFQCRDEGLLRARVRWIRGNGLPLPPGSRDINGRLEIPNIQLEHAGTYICEAVGYPPSTPGRQLNVILSVEKFEQPSTRPPQVCHYDQATCSNGDCIPKSYVCDGKFDCTDGSDEMRCSPHGCEPNEFRCNNKQCVSKLWRCDGDKDCADNSDEENCAPSPPGSPCRYNEFACSSNKQCIPKSYHCDMERDCLDGSDEVGCSPVYIIKPPPPMVVLVPGDVLVLTCTAIGVPIPEINWRLNWGHIPAKCTTVSTNGTGTLTCPDIQLEDQGAYSCEALNVGGFVFAVPDAIVVVKEHPNVCPRGKFNSEAKIAEECISCFCFGVATECRSADLFTYQIPPPFDRHKIVSVETAPTIRVFGDVSNQISEIRPLGRDGVQLMESFSNELDTNVYNVPYFALPENYHGSQLKSYGGYLRYTIHHSGNGTPNNAPSVILSGNNYILMHKGEQPTSDYENERSVRFFYGEWYKQQGRSEVLASREEIMMALANVDNILIKVKYDDSPQLVVRLTNIVMDTADVRNTGLGSASFVEECQCPTGYTGLSCEHCAPGYLRRESGPWLGQCYRDEPPCPPGYYGDPSRNIPCQTCPCPLTNPSNQFARTCHLGSDGQPTCDCPPGYVGRRCEQCDVGYQGNPLIPGDMCVPLQQCDPNGSLSPNADNTGKCHCKQYATGLTCNQCKANTFNLASANQFGCIACFCMGITNRCVSSNWYRNEVRVSFTNSIRGFSLIESKSTDTPDIVEGIHLNTISREIIYSDFPNRGNNDVYYWQLPSIFLGDQITSYGGNLKYTVRYVPSPGGQSSRNNAADVELISANDINLLYYSRESPEPNSQQSFTVPLLEQYWQRNDGTQADREHLLMALADVRAIRIKATYTTHTDEAALSFVSLDTAEKFNTGKARAVEVEECTCPAGYRGLSCEDCDVGYTRAIEGLYLGICEPCNCNNHSNQCDPETGTCENCAHHTTGEYCELCEPGYEGDPTRGTPNDCTYRRPKPEPCRCNEAGARSTSCVDGRCECKRNVEGPECNRCRPSTYGLRAENIDGCVECYCSGVTDQCHESTLYVQQIPMWVYDSHHGFTLTDSTRRDIIDDGFELNVAMNEIGYRYPDSRSRRLFWSLPSVFTGNKVKSYGGNLTLTQHITAYPGAQSYKDQDILLIGNGITLFWTNPVELQPEIPLTYTVPLKEHEWRRLTTEGPRSASRTDLMIVLSNLEAILVRASHSERMTATYISDISMDTAVENLIENRRATQIEACRCPTGYTGTSCETCARGYYRDTSDRTVSYLGACNLCPCNKNEESCEISRSGHIKCHCLSGFTGQYCQDSGEELTTTTPGPIPPPRIIIYIQEPEFQIVHTGNTVRYHCTGRSKDSESVHIRWEKEGDQLPPGRSLDDANGLLVIRDVKVSDSGVYVCQVSDGINIGYKKVTLTVGGANPVEPKVVINPPYQQVKEGEPVEFRCEATGNPPPQLDWIRVHGSMSPEATFYNGVWSLLAASKNDAAEYKCIARNNVGTDEKTTILYVQDNPNKPPPQGLPPTITPSEWSGTSGDVVRLICTPSQYANVTWTRSGGLPLPYTASQRDGILTITNPTHSDSGIYVCTATNIYGTETSTTAKITIEPRTNPPTVKVKPERQEVSQGTVAEVRCITSGEPGVQVKWSKYTETMSSRVQQVGDTLRIINAQVSDRGVYICHVTSPSGSYEASAIIEVERREAPVLELYPQDVQTVLLGGSADLQCRAKAGFPVPELHWSRQDHRPFPSNVEQLFGGLLRLTNITANDGGAYICSASNEVGSTSAIAHIEVQSLPVITITPKHGILQVKRGSRVRLMCSASGHPQPNVAWSRHVNGITIHDTFSRSAATPLSAVYEIFSVSPDDEGSYTCQATNTVGIAEERIQIRIEDDDDYVPCTGDRGDIPCDDRQRPQPDDRDPNQTGGGVLIPEDYLRIPNGGKVEMRCQVFGPDGNHIYLDWKRSDHRSLPEGSTVHNGVLSIPTVDRNAAGEYICLGLDPAGTVLFRAKSHLEIISPPRIELNPTRQTVGPGENPSIICTATGDEPLHIEWEAIGRPLPYSVSHSGGILQFHGITYADAGKYVCKATNAAGTAEAVAEVLVNEHPYDNARIRAEQGDVETHVGNSVRLRCETRERALIHWSREGQPLPANARIGEDYLELMQVKPEDSGRYICQIQSSRGVSSDYINLNVSPAAVPSVSIEVSQDPINIGDTVDIHCTYTGTRSPRYRWTRPSHLSLPPNAQEYGNILRLTNVAVSDSGPYRCMVDTSEGILEKDFNLIVHGGILDEPALETKFAPYGSSLEMDCRLDLEPPIQFQWNKLGGLLPRDSQTYENKLKLTNVKAEDAGTYICVGNNGETRVEVPTVLVVTGVVPNFSQAPESYIAFPPLPDSYLKFNIEISFKPESYDGILLYNDESGHDNGDFIVLSLNNGYPQFKFNLGSGPAVIRADKPVTLSEWHTIKVQRNRREGTMLVDGEGPYKMVALGRRQGLDLKEPLYIGGVPSYSRINKQAEASTGFVGCISRLVLGEKQVDLMGDQTESVGITTCETCAENPCNNGGVCQEAATKNGYTCLCRAGFSGKHCDNVGQSCYSGACGEGKCVDKEIGFDCYCPIGKTGSRCEHSVDIYDPAFHDDRAFIAHETPKALRWERESSTTTHSRSRLRNAQVRKPRSRPHHHNNLHYTKKH